MKVNDGEKGERDKFGSGVNNNSIMLEKLCEILKVERSDKNE